MGICMSRRGSSEDECSYHFYFAQPNQRPSPTRPTSEATSRPAMRQREGPGPHNAGGAYPPNKLGLYDMHGNVFQWCADLYDPRASNRVIRGGCWCGFGDSCRAAYRGGDRTVEAELRPGGSPGRVPTASAHSWVKLRRSCARSFVVLYQCPALFAGVSRRHARTHPALVRWDTWRRSGSTSSPSALLPVPHRPPPHPQPQAPPDRRLVIAICAMVSGSDGPRPSTAGPPTASTG